MKKLLLNLQTRFNYRYYVAKSQLEYMSVSYFRYIYYRMLNDTDPSNIVQQRVTQFADKYKSMLTLK